VTDVGDTVSDLDVVGPWTEVKLQILDEYSAAYTAILKKQDSVIQHFAYIDGFAGAGKHISRETKEMIEGSPSIALSKGFSHCHFIDLDGTRAAHLTEIASGREDVTVYQGDCNEVLLEKVFPTCRFEDYRRALCLLDPYNLNPSWEVVRTAGAMRSIEIFVIFMVMHAHRNVLHREGPQHASATEVAKLTAFWGDETWIDAAYRTRPGLFEEMREKARNEELAQAYRARLQSVAQFKYVLDPLPMRNSKGNVIYYLYFASHNQVGYKIARSIFSKHRG